MTPERRSNNCLTSPNDSEIGELDRVADQITAKFGKLAIRRGVGHDRGEDALIETLSWKSRAHRRISVRLEQSHVEPEVQSPEVARACRRPP